MPSLHWHRFDQFRPLSDRFRPLFDEFWAGTGPVVSHRPAAGYARGGLILRQAAERRPGR
jgi:hypothetical protein